MRVADYIMAIIEDRVESDVAELARKLNDELSE